MDDENPMQDQDIETIRATIINGVTQLGSELGAIFNEIGRNVNQICLAYDHLAATLNEIGRQVGRKLRRMTQDWREDERRYKRMRRQARHDHMASGKHTQRARSAR